jgi:DNA-binding protein H-NS
MILGALLVARLLPLPSSQSTAVVDLVQIIELQREEVLKKAENPEAAERMMQQRIEKIREILHDLSKEEIIWNKAAVVSGEIHDVTDEIEAALRLRGSK